MSASVPTVVSKQSAIGQTTSLTLSYTPTVSGVYRLSAYFIRTQSSGNSGSLHFEWTDDATSWSYAPNSGPGKTVGMNDYFAQPLTMLVRCISGQPISLVYTVNSGTPSVDMYFQIEDMN